MSILPRSKIMPQPGLTYGASEKKGNTRRQCKFEDRSIVIIYIHVCDMYIIIYIYIYIFTSICGMFSFRYYVYIYI